MSYKDDKASPFGGGGGVSNSEVNQAVYGRIDDAPISGAVRIKPVGLDEIRPDLKQPRRAIPQKVRGDWNGNPAKISDLLMKWRIQCQMATGAKIPSMPDLLMGLVDFPDEYENFGGTVGAYVELVRLAQRIYAEGLQNPITIYEADGYKFILTGERRYLAHWLLRLEIDREKWSKIPAQVVGYSVRQQISENTARRDLNAVGLARCYAMMVIELYAEEGKQFKSFQLMVRPGECDRAYYAQVADVNVPYGKSAEVMSALSVKNRMSISQYKAVLSVSDDVWMRADDEDWSLTAILEWLKAQKPQPVRENVNRNLHSDGDNPQRLAPPSLRNEGEQSAPVVVARNELGGVRVRRESQWDDDEDMRPRPPAPSPAGGEKAAATVVETPPGMEGATWFVDDPDLINLLEMWLKIFERRGDEYGVDVTKSLLTFNASMFDGYRDLLDLQAALGEVLDMFSEHIEELTERLIGLHEKISSEYEDLYGIG